MQVAMLLDALVRNTDLSLSAIVMNEGRLASELRASGVDTLVIPEDKLGLPGIISQAVRHIAQFKPRVLHSHRYKENLVARIAAWRCGVPVLVRTQHGLPEPFAGLRHGKQMLTQFLDRLIARYATSGIISVSQEMQSHLGRSIPGRRIFTIPNGLDCRRVHSKLSRVEAKARLGFAGQEPVLGTAARVEPIKRLDLFIRAAALVLAREPRARFLVVGDGSDLPRLRELARNIGCAGRFTFLGHRDDIHDILRALDVFVMSSDHEGLPMVLLEALYLGTPVVARAVGGISEVLDRGACGLLVDSADPAALSAACLQVLCDSGLRERLQQQGPARVAAAYDVQQTASRVAELYRELLRTK